MEDRFLFMAKRVDGKNGGWAIGNYVNGGFIITLTNERVRIFENTICRCTGVKDKNGRLIWENSILIGHGDFRIIAKVVFGKFTVVDAKTQKPINVIGWYYEVIIPGTLNKYLPLTDECIDECDFTVVGNILNIQDSESEESNEQCDRKLENT